MQRWIQKTNRRWQPIERLENADEILALIREQFLERVDTRRFVLGENHLTHRVDPVAFEKHVFGAAKADPLRTESDRVLDLLRRVGVGAHPELSHAIDPSHQPGVLLLNGALFSIERTIDPDLDDLGGRRHSPINLPGGSVDENVIASSRTPRAAVARL